MSKTHSNKNNRYDQPNNDMDSITMTFHVHLPFDVTSHKPAVIGSGEALGEWKTPKIWLRNIQQSTLWVSDPVRVPNRLDIEYKYCLMQSGWTSGWTKKTIKYEGCGPNDNRKMELRNNQYDLWKISPEFKYDYNILLHDYKFINYIYNTIISPDSLMEGINDYQYIYKNHKYITSTNTSVDFISQNLVKSKTIEQKLFLCILLGYYMDENRNSYRSNVGFPHDFPSTTVLKELENIQPDFVFPLGTEQLFVQAINALVRHNSEIGFLDWLKMFELAPRFDKSYTFIDSIVVCEYMYIENSNQLIKSLDEVKPYISKLHEKNEHLLIKTLEKLIMMSCDVKILAFLRENFKGFEDNFRISQNLRRKLLELIEQKHLIWDHDGIMLFCEFLRDPNLRWLSEHYVRILEAIAESNDIILLEFFPEVLELNLGTDVNKKSLEETLINWFIKICRYKSVSTTIVQKSLAYNIFYYLSIMFSNLTYGKILNTLKNHDIVKNLSDDNIFSIASYVDDFHQDVKTYIMFLMEERIISSINFDKYLLKKVMIICGSESNLVVRNSICEEVLCKVLSRLEQTTSAHDEESFQISLFQFAEFWISMFDAEGSTQKLHAHSYFRKSLETVILLATEINDRTIKIGLLQRIFDHFANNYGIFEDFINSAIKIHPKDNHIIAEEFIEEIHIQYDIYNSSFTFLNKFYERFYSSTEAKPFIEDLQEKSITVILEELYAKDHWTIHSGILEAMKDAYQLVDSQIFRNIFQDKTIFNNAEGLEDEECFEVTVNNDNDVFNFNLLFTEIAGEKYEKEMRAKIMTIKESFKYYKNICQEFMNNWREIKCVSAIEIWKNVDEEKVEEEINFMIPYYNKQRQFFLFTGTEHMEDQIVKLVNAVKQLINIPSTLEKLDQLITVFNIFEITYDKNIWLRKINEFENENLSLGQLFKWFDQLKQAEEIYFLTNSWSIIKEIASAKVFIIFLKSLVGHDIKNLINGVDDHSDERLIQEDTVRTFIQVKQIMESLLVERKKYNEYLFLQKLRDTLEANPSLVNNLRLCHTNTQALKHMYETISNRGEVTKEKIFLAVTKGTYLFKRMENDEGEYTAILSYPSKISQDETARYYNLSDLQDLRGRALLIAKAPTNTKALNDEDCRPYDITSDHINDFVIQVDTAQKIVNTTSSLKEIGHFKYRDFSESINSDTFIMKELLQSLIRDLQEWKEIVNEAQQDHYYLTFFLSQHILYFYDYFSCNRETSATPYDIEDKCSMLLKFVNDKAELPYVESDVLNIPLIPENYLSILCKIGAILYDIFSIIPITQRQINAYVEPNVADMVNQGQLFIGTCNDKFLVPNIIMSLYYLHNKCYPEAWQLLICKPSTKAEELLTFTRRCFFASMNNYEEHLFCIANVEVLDFELQYQLVTDIRNLYNQKKFYLALICCHENGMHHHIIDQFSECVHMTKGIDGDSMRNIYKELCPNVQTVSSDLSGQGKTKWIEENSLENQLNPRNFLISDGMTFGMLVRHLSEIRLQMDESLHLNIMLIDHPYDVNMFLFELLSFKIVWDKTYFFSIPSTLIYVEVASTINQALFNSIPITSHLINKHLKWNINDLIVSHDSSIQIVAKYLDAHDCNVINTVDLFFDDEQQFLSNSRCQKLLQKYFFDKCSPDILSYRFLEIFVNVLANQLFRMSSSVFFRVDTLKFIDADENIRKTLLETLIEVSKDFATRSVDSRAAQLKNLTNLKDIAINNKIRPWEDSNHLLVFFLSQSPDSICSLYHDKDKVPKNVVNLLRSQHLSGPMNSFTLDDYHELSSEDILMKLESIACMTSEQREYPLYALSADNLLKMALILLRSRANVPVVVCGEAGCGKTSLIQFLSIAAGVELLILNVHAGVNEKQIFNFVLKAEKIAQEREVWLFFDEINTCNHIGILADLIAHRLLLGNKIHENIRLFAACNPYRLRQKADTQAGLSKRYEEKSSLVYQVRPLPDQILDFVWDFGVLKPSDEMIYIEIMVKKFLLDSHKNLETSLFVALLVESQEFIRDKEGTHGVSLRDVKRAIIIFKFFCESLEKRQELADSPGKSKNILKSFLKSIKKMAKQNAIYGKEILGNIVKSYVLALSLCYQVRFFEQEIRDEYQNRMCKVFERFGISMNEKTFETIIQEEQKDFMKRMTKPSMIAENFALLENVLVMTVCILTRIPLFIIGAPGASKSLAIRMVSQSLRGADSEDPYFRTLPQVYIIPHQGSSSSTSDGIIKVFDKAYKYQNGSKEFQLITVVLLDEIGLAEKSPHNPLKVLHSILEPNYPAELPEVSIIGISNWRLDNSKSSRALLVQRPEFKEKDLIDTAKRILGKKTDIKFNTLAKSYLEYEEDQRIPNFHGLRDYYSLVKSLGNKMLTSESTQMALLRNFGGTDQMNDICPKYFNDFLNEFHNHPIKNRIKYSVEDLIKANLEDKNARHLMIIGKRNSILNILTYKLREWNKEFSDKDTDLEPVIIYGSQFANDFDGDYQYSVLCRIMMCVEAGRPLILTDLDTIYGSLYDLWNQNYITVGKEGNQTFYTRVALGAYSNPMVCVHKNFRCILVLDKKEVDFSDPPLLNRFEKQKLSIDDVMDDNMKRLVKELEKWTNHIGNIAASEFNEKDIFVGFNKEETLQSLVISNSNDPNLNDDDILNKCKELLMGIALSDGIIRSKKSMISNIEINNWYDFYFKQRHEDLDSYIQSSLKDSARKEQGINTIIYTFSNVNTDITSLIMNCQVEKLSTFKSEAHFQSRIRHFWLESKDESLILQCDIATVKSGCIKFAKFTIEQYRNEFIMTNNSEKQIKHAYIIIHLKREHIASTESLFNFMCGWDQITIETLEPQEYPLITYMDNDLVNIMNESFIFEEIINRELLWCLLCMKFPQTYESAKYLKMLVQQIPCDKDFVDWLKNKTIDWLKSNLPKDWQLDVATNKTDLYLYSSLSLALQAYIRNLVRKPVARLLFAAERVSGLSIFSDNPAPFNAFSFWKPAFMDPKILNIENIIEPRPDAYQVPEKIDGMRLPFSICFIELINKFKGLYQDDLIAIEKNIDDEDDEVDEFQSNIVIEKFSMSLTSIIPALKLLQNDLADLYFKDFVTFILHGDDNNNQLLCWIISHNMKQETPDPIKLHIFWWDYADLVLAEFQLVLLCLSIKNKILDIEFYESNELDFEDNLLKQVSDIMINKLFNVINENDSKVKRKDGDESIEIEDIIITYYESIEIVEIEEDNTRNDEGTDNEVNKNENDMLQLWQCEVAKILSLSCKLENSFENSSLQKLRVYNDLSKSFSLPQLLEIRQLDMSTEDDIFSEQFISLVLNKFDKTEKTEISLLSRHSFINRCLDIIPLESTIRSHLYKKIFSQEPLPLTFYTIYLIFEAENRAQEELLFFNLIDDLDVFNDSKQLQDIENTLFEQKNSAIAALCCDVIQTQFFMKHKFEELFKYFLNAINILINNNVKALQLVTVIALLKTIADKLWNHTRSIKTTLEFTFEDYANENDIFDVLNQRLKINYNLIYSFKIYLLKALRLKGLLIDEIKQFCNIHQHLLPWVKDLEWSDDNRLGFNPYWYFEPFKHIDISFRKMLHNDESYSETIFNSFIENNDIAQKISFAGMVISNFYIVRASRNLNQAENILKEKISSCLESSQLQLNYKTYLINFMSNNYQLYKLNPNIKNTEMFISSVIAHIVALHISIPANASPFAAYMQELHDHNDTYILTCPSDELSVMTNVIISADQGTRRCDYIYFIANCGRPEQEGECPQCRIKIGAKAHHILADENVNIDNDRITQQIAVNDKKGYIVEEKCIDYNYYSVRTMHPATYRILRLFLHSIIGIQANSLAAIDFINSQDNDINDIISYCKKHIENDWKILKNIFACEDETLALVIHAILSEMSQEPQNIIEKFTTSIQRDDWEEQFNKQYVLPKIRNFMGTANDFRLKIATLQLKTEDEINETINITEDYNEKHLPWLWRLIGKPDINNFRSYYMADNERIKSFPFLNIFLKHEKNLKLIQFLLPIVKFVKILSSSLSHQVEREKAYDMTFQQFINDESKNDSTGETKKSLEELFEGFARSWNYITPYIKRYQYQCHQLPSEIPEMHSDLSVIYGLYEPINESLFLCAAIEFLVKLQNNFLNDIKTISPTTCQSLKFIEETDKHEPKYCIQSTFLENAKQENIIHYKDISEIFIYSQYDLRFGHGQEIQYDLYRIEAELAIEFVSAKRIIENFEENLYLNKFIYHKELFSGSMTILREIKDLLYQESIPNDKKPTKIENPKELLSTLEMIFCFLKKTSGEDCNILITDYISKWMQLSILKKNNSSYKLLVGLGLQLKHVVALYELIEEHVADVVFNCLPFKYQSELNESMRQEIMAAINFEPIITREFTEISAEAFVIALKRFIVRYLSTDCKISESASLFKYLAEYETLECWPDYVSIEILKDKFPRSLLVSHAYDAYYFVKEEIDRINLSNQENLIMKESKENQVNKKKKKDKGKDRSFRKS
ncbi:e3 ubiquitin-protein ligase [Gigaspora margarita]|uniref:E3 ubiquitin-protein ligase n=1 Tax=Gigaspora margarita TaxID=4874 RepID=A0A8H4EME2_GIGMA|nr:e3 ubiquitin-protein ligase [Gigaspora margarita]